MLETILEMPETLAQFVSRIMIEKNLSSYDVERLSRKTVSQTNVNRIQNAEVLNPGAKTLKGLAKGLGIPEHDLFAVARGVDPKATLTHERLAAIDVAYKTLSRGDKTKADLFIEMLEREINHIAAQNRHGGVELAPSSRTTILHKTSNITKDKRRAQ